VCDRRLGKSQAAEVNGGGGTSRLSVRCSVLRWRCLQAIAKCRIITDLLDWMPVLVMY